MNEPVYIEGACHCGHIRYRLSDRPTVSHICHCESCQRASGAPMMAWVTFPTRAFSFVQGEPFRYRYQRDESDWATRIFCSCCGTHVAYESDDGDSIDVTACTLDQPDAFPPESHEWTTEKRAWVDLWPLPSDG